MVKFLRRPELYASFFQNLTISFQFYSNVNVTGKRSPIFQIGFVIYSQIENARAAPGGLTIRRKRLGFVNPRRAFPSISGKLFDLLILQHSQRKESGT